MKNFAKIKKKINNKVTCLPTSLWTLHCRSMTSCCTILCHSIVRLPRYWLLHCVFLRAHFTSSINTTSASCPSHILYNAPFKVKTKEYKNIGGSKGGARDARPPRGPNSFIFMQFSAKFWKIIAILGVGAPPLGKSWIRHWRMHSIRTVRSSSRLLGEGSVGRVVYLGGVCQGGVYPGVSVGGCLPRGCLPGVCESQYTLRQTPQWTVFLTPDWKKTLPFRNFVCGR